MYSNTCAAFELIKSQYLNKLPIFIRIVKEIVRQQSTINSKVLLLSSLYSEESQMLGPSPSKFLHSTSLLTIVLTSGGLSRIFLHIHVDDVWVILMCCRPVSMFNTFITISC